MCNYSLDHGTHGGQNHKGGHVTHPLKVSADFNMLQSTSSNPTLGTAVLASNNTTASEVLVTSTTLDDQPMLEITSSNGSKSAVVSSVVNNDIYTLTLTDGSIVQLRVTNEGQNQSQNSVSVENSAAASEMATLENVTQTWLPSSHDHQNYQSETETVVQNGMVDQTTGTIKLEVDHGSNSQQIVGHNNQSSASVSPASFAEEVTLPFTCANGSGSSHCSGKSIFKQYLL